MSGIVAEAPEVIEKVKSTRYSVARIYGRVTIQGQTYLYERKTDTLIRLDVHRQREAQRKAGQC
ncbi:TPA: hypothetical protein ACP31Y_005211 [Pseudomonas aeruginosa]|nr:hypothetical protein [Pseudomonas aeruginosa]